MYNFKAESGKTEVQMLFDSRPRAMKAHLVPWGLSGLRSLCVVRGVIENTRAASRWKRRGEGYGGSVKSFHTYLWPHDEQNS